MKKTTKFKVTIKSFEGLMKVTHLYELHHLKVISEKELIRRLKEIRD